MIPTNVIPFPEVGYAMRFGYCPKCGKNDGFVNLGKEHWFICREHKMKWFGGSNMFDGWENQTVAQTLGIEAMLNDYQEVLPNRQNVEDQILRSINT